LRGSFSAVSKPNFPSKYSLELAICSKRRLRKGTWGETRWKALDEIYKIYIYASLGEKNRIENEIMKMYTNKKYSTEKAE